MADINGDGQADLIFAHYNHSGILWIDFSGPEPKVHHVGEPAQDGHGIGVADVDGDGKADILTPTGWFRQIDADKDEWEWHGDWDLGDAGFPIIGYDVFNNGQMDILYGQGHSYGIYWLEQQGDGPNRKWVKHTIDESFSQVHALKMVDIDGDGQMELLAGKRYRGHNGERSRFLRSAGCVLLQDRPQDGGVYALPDQRERNGGGGDAVCDRRSGWRWRY